MAEPESQCPTFKLILVGDANVGKTTFANRYIAPTSTHWHDHLPITIHHITLQTTHGPIQFNLWDTPTQVPRYPAKQFFPPAYYANADCALLMFTTTARITYKNMHHHWHDDLSTACAPLPTVLVSTKNDIRERSVLPRQIQFHRPEDSEMSFVAVSAKANWNVERVFVELARRLLGREELEVVGWPGMTEAEVEMDGWWGERVEVEIRKARETEVDGLAGDDDDDGL